MAIDAANAVLTQMEAAMKDRMARMQKEMSVMRTGRANPMMLESVKVEAYGSLVPLKQVAAVSVPEARTLEIRPWDPSTLQDIEKALQKAEVGAMPQSDGKMLRIELPALSGDQRKKFAGKIKELCEEARVALRNGRRDANKVADQAKKDGDQTEDENRKMHDDIQELLKEYEGTVDGILDAKTKEVLDV